MATILQQPDQYSFAGNIKNIIIATEEKISFILKHDSVVLFESSYEPDLNDQVEIDIKKIVQDALTSVMPGTGDITTRNFPAFSYAVDTGEDVVFYAFEGGVDAEIASSWFAENFLTWQPQTSYVTWNQAQFLSYIALQACNLKIKGYFADDTNQTITFAALELNKINTANLQFSTMPVKFGNKQPQYIDVWTENAQAVRLSYVQRFVLKNTTFDDDFFIFKNTLGGWDSVVFTGTLKNEGTSDVKTFAQEDTTSEYQVDIIEKYSKNTGLFLSEKHRQWILEFFKTKERFYLSHRAIYEQITVLASSLSSQKSNPSSYSLTFSLSRSTKFLNLSRTETPDLPLEIIDPEGELFFLAPRLVDFPQAEINPELLFAVQSPYTQEWKKISYQQLINEIDKSIGEWVVRMDVDSSLGWMIGTDETTVLSVKVYKRWVDITSLMASWTWTRTSGDAADDLIWNHAHASLTNSAEISFADLGNSLQTNVSCTFTIRATYDDLTISTTIEI